MIAEAEPPVRAEPVLRAVGVRRRFGGLLAVDVDEITVAQGRITALIGPNGAGKTTFFNVLTGFDRADSGTWWLDGVEVTGWPAHRLARAGMIRTFQLTKTLAKMSVLDNMLVGGSSQRGERMLASLIAPLWQEQERELRARALDLLERFNLSAHRNDYAGTLSGGQRKLLELARALMAQPRMILLDEPMAGVNPALVQSLLAHVIALRDDGLSVLFVEHDMDVVMGISDRVVCMAEGRVIADGAPADVARDPRVIDAYLGTHYSERGA